MRFGSYHIELASVRRRKWMVWLPDGLHVWRGVHGVHLYWGVRPRVEREQGDAK